MTTEPIYYDTDGAELITSRDGLIAEIERLKTENADLQSTFDLQQKRMGAAIEFWQQHNDPEIIPDLGKLLEWFVEMLTKTGDDNINLELALNAAATTMELIEIAHREEIEKLKSSTDERERLAEELIEWVARPGLHCKIPITQCLFCGCQFPNEYEAHNANCLHLRALALRGKAEK